MNLRIPVRLAHTLHSFSAIKSVALWIALAMTAQVLAAKPAPHVPKSIVSDWTQRHVLYPDSKNESVLAQYREDPRWELSWYLRHREAWWPEFHPAASAPVGEDPWEESHIVRRELFLPEETVKRDWNIALGTATFLPIIDYSFIISTQTAYGSLNVTDLGGGSWLATSGNLTVTGGSDVGTYSLIPGGPGVTLSPLGSFDYNDVIYPSANPALDVDGLLFGDSVKEINVWGTGTNSYSFYDSTAPQVYGTQLNATGTFSFQPAPGAGEGFPAKYVFDVTATPSCSSDFVAIGIGTNPVSGGQANILGVNNLYSTSPASSAPNCTTNGPTVMFAYASGSGGVPGSLAISQNGTQLAFIENQSGKSYFHILTIGTTGSNGTSPTSAVVPGTGNNAGDKTVLLSPDGGVTNQGATSSPFITYTHGDASDAAYVTTYSPAGSGSGYLYKISNVFNGGAAPTIMWSVAINAEPSSPNYETTSNRVFFTDSKGRIDYVVDSGASPSVVYGPIVASGTTSLNPVLIDNGSQNIYATFNTNGTNAIVVQAPTSLASSVSVPVGTGNTTYTGPYGVEFNNAWYTGVGTPLMYVVGTGSGTTPTLYSVGFNAGGLMNGTANGTTAALTTGAADASPLTEYYNAALAKDFLFVGVTNNCEATTGGGPAGCVMALDITAGFPTVTAGTTSLAAAGGTTGIIVDNDSSISQASSIYYATKTGQTLVKATQQGLN
jgi:hypothetical protein